MKALRTLSAAAILVVLAVVAATAAPGPKVRPVKLYEEGEGFCPSAALVYGNVIIEPGRCYTLFILHATSGTFLAFGPPGPPMIPPGQLVRLSTPAGAKVRGRFFYLVPIQTSVILVPVNTVALVGVRVEDLGPRVSIALIGVPAPNVVVIFNVRL